MAPGTADPSSAVRKQGGLPACKLEEHSPLPQKCAPSLGHPGVLPATKSGPSSRQGIFLGEQLQEEKLPGGLVTAPDDVVSAGSGHWFVLEELFVVKPGRNQAGRVRSGTSNILIG